MVKKGFLGGLIVSIIILGVGFIYFSFNKTFLPFTKNASYNEHYDMMKLFMALIMGFSPVSIVFYSISIKGACNSENRKLGRIMSAIGVGFGFTILACLIGVAVKAYIIGMSIVFCCVLFVIELIGIILVLIGRKEKSIN